MFLLGPHYGSQQRDEEMARLIQDDRELSQQTGQLVGQIRQAKAEELAKLKIDLSKLIDQHFDVRQKRRELELKRLEEMLTRLSEVIKRRSDSRELIVGKRLSELLGEQYELDF